MSSRSRALSRVALPAFVLLAILAGSVALQAQTKQLLQWRSDLNYLQGASPEDLMTNRPGIESIRAGVELWVKMRPGTKIELQPAPEMPWGADELLNQVTALREAVDTILKEEIDRPFDLGTTTISVSAEASPLSPISEGIGRTEIQNLQATNVGVALDYLPGVSLDRSATRNEAQIRLRGFTNRGQIPLYLDGIPIQVPYDGTIDFSRFLTGDIAEIQVAKGYSSPLMGANNLGGSINLVTRQPDKKLNMDALIGTGSGDTLLASYMLGSRWEKFFVQGGIDWLQKDFIPLSGDYPLDNPNQTNYELNHSDSRDAKYTGRFGFTPKAEDQYVFTYINQKGEKGNPLYSGPNLGARSRYWYWPEWNKTSYYVNTNTGIGEASSIRFRLFYDQFQNSLASYDDATYSTMNTRRAFFSVYDDHAGGASADFTTRILPRNTISASIFFKDDTHKAYEIVPRLDFTTATTLDRVQTFSFGFQDVIAVTSKLQATFGFNADYLNGRQTQQLNEDETGTVPVQCLSDPNNDSFAGCTPDMWVFSPQISMSYAFTDRDKLFATFSDRGRFPLMKELYTASLGTRLPNPDLEAEHSTNWSVGFSHIFSANTVAQIEFYRSDMRNSINDVYVPDPEGYCWDSDQPGWCQQFANAAEEDHGGVEISIRSTPISRLTLDASYTYLNRSISFDDDVLRLNPAEMLLPTLPKNKVIFNAFFTLPRDILALGTFRYEGGINIQDNTYSPLPPADSTSYGILDIGTVVPIYKGASLQAGIKNLFDRNFFYTPGYPEAGRNWYFNMRYKF